MCIIVDNTPISSVCSLLTSHEQQPAHISTQVHLSFEYNCLFKGRLRRTNTEPYCCFFALLLLHYLKETKRKIVDHSKQFVTICLFRNICMSIYIYADIEGLNLAYKFTGILIVYINMYLYISSRR